MVINLVGGLFFLLGGLYYIIKAEKACAMFYKAVSYLPKGIQVFFPIKFYHSATFVVLMRIGGLIAVAAGLFLFVSLYWHWHT